MELTDFRCQCRGCRDYFNSVAAFDKHRTGEGAKRHCRTIDEMKAKKMAKNDAGFWVTELMHETGFR